MSFSGIWVSHSFFCICGLSCSNGDGNLCRHRYGIEDPMFIINLCLTLSLEIYGSLLQSGVLTAPECLLFWITRIVLSNTMSPLCQPFRSMLTLMLWIHLLNQGLFPMGLVPPHLYNMFSSFWLLFHFCYGRRPGDSSDSDFRDSSSDVSSDSDSERVSATLDHISLRDQHQEDSSSDDGEPLSSQGRLIFEYLERDLPYIREPLADKVCAFISLLKTPHNNKSMP